jgi:hypothetical protein
MSHLFGVYEYLALIPVPIGQPFLAFLRALRNLDPLLRHLVGVQRIQPGERKVHELRVPCDKTTSTSITATALAPATA